jgi:hypothetical protein
MHVAEPRFRTSSVYYQRCPPRMSVAFASLISATALLVSIACVVFPLNAALDYTQARSSNASTPLLRGSNQRGWKRYAAASFGLASMIFAKRFAANIKESKG